MVIFALSLAFFLFQYRGYSKSQPRALILPSIKTTEDVESGIKDLRDSIDRLDERARSEEKKIEKVKKKLHDYEKDWLNGKKRFEERKEELTGKEILTCLRARINAKEFAKEEKEVKGKGSEKRFRGGFRRGAGSYRKESEVVKEL